MSVTGPRHTGPLRDATPASGEHPAAVPAEAPATPAVVRGAGGRGGRPVIGAAPAPAAARASSRDLAPAAGESPRDWAVRTAERLRASSDAEKPALLGALESYVAGGGHDRWEAVYDDRRVVEALAATAQETLDPAVEGRAARVLLKVYADHYDDDGSASSALKNVVTSALCEVWGGDVFAATVRTTGREDLARAIVTRAEEGLGNEDVRAGDAAPLLREMGIDGSGTTVMVIDDEGSDHMAHTTYLASPALAGSRLLPYGSDSMTGHAFVGNILRALEAARREGVDVVSISAGIAWESDGDDYVERCGGDERRAKAMYEDDMRALRSAIEAFPGVVVAAAGNGGPGSQPNDVARSPNVLVAAALDAPERRTAGFTSPAHNPASVVGIGTTVWAPGAGGDMQLLEDATSWAAPQIAHFAACVVQAGRQFDQRIDAGEVRSILARTAEPVLGGARNADVVSAVRFAKTLAYVKSLGDERLLRKLWDLPPSRAREVASIVEPMLHDLGPSSRARIARAIEG